MTKRAGEKNIQARHDARKRKRIREQKIRRTIFFTVIALIVVLCFMYFTPVFNIKNVNINGTQMLSLEEVNEHIGDIEGKNLFRFGAGRVKRRVLNLAYVDKVSIKRKVFPPTVVIDITEREAAFQINFGGKFVLIDKTGKVLGTEEEQQVNIALIEGVPVSSANKGSEIAFKSSAKQKIIMLCISYMDKADILKDVTKISFEDTSNIKFNYQSRLDVICGNEVDFQRKLALFKEAISSNKLTENSRGTINLSTTGKAIYTP